MKKITPNALLWALLLCLPMIAGAQTTAKLLEQGVEEYNATRTYMNDLTAKNITQANITDIKARMDKGFALLDKVIKEGNSEEIKTARYFKLNFKYQYGFANGMIGENKKIFDIFKEIEKDFTGYSSSDFPLRYVFFEKNYIIKWEDFASTQAEYYAALGEIAYNLNKYEDAARITRLALVHPNTSDWLKYVSYNKMLDINEKDGSLIGVGELQDFALQTIKSYDILSDESKKTVDEFNYPRVIRGVSLLFNSAEANRTPLALTRCSEAAPIAAKYEPRNAKLLDLYSLCYRNRQTGGVAFHTGAADYAQDAIAVDRAKAEYVGLAATDYLTKMAALNDCPAYEALAERYRFWNKTDLQAQYTAKAKACADEQAKALIKAEKEAKKAARASGRSGGSNFNLYVGAHILPLLNTNPKRDYGAAVDFVFGNTAVEFSYTKVKQNKENIFDLWLSEVEGADQDNISRWDGFKAHIQPKFMERYGNDLRSYLGVLLGYNEKTFDEMTVNVTNDLSGVISAATFKPAVTQYVAMVNFGVMGLGKGYGIDAFWGLGANYSHMDTGNTAINREEYTIDNPLLEYRKDKYFGFVMRLGFTMGINFGRGMD